MPAADATGAALEVAAPAKVNLYLHVTGRRADGYHELDSLFVRAGVADRLILEPAGRLSLEAGGPFAAALGGEGDNLVLTAARRLARELGREPGVAIRLTKNLPVAAGLGGGSADAAAALRALVALWHAELDADRLAAVALDLGADVPACLHPEPLLVSGIGERLRPAPNLPPAWLVLVNPGVEVATADVFRRFAGAFGPAQPLDEAPADAAALAAALKERRNDLEAAAVALAPAIGEVLAELARMPEIMIARMSGSGATCFGLAATEDEARQAAARLRMARRGWWIEPAAVLGPQSSDQALPLAARSS
jgi:4-diphosphocytidyl-2-C-methyl-D-erythritol kinase